MMTKDGMYCAQCQRRVTGQGSINRRATIRYHCPLCSGPVQTRTIIRSPGVGSYDTRTFFPDGRALRPDDPPPLKGRHDPPPREPMDSTAWAGLIVLVSCVVTVVGIGVADLL